MGDLCSGSFFPPTIISIFKSFQIHSTSTEGKHDRYKNIPIVIFHCVNILHLVYPLISWWKIEFSYLLDVLNNADVNTQLQVFGCMLSILHLVNVWVSQMALVVKNPPANTGDIEIWVHSWIRKIPWKRAWQPISVFLLGESHGLRSLVGYSPLSREESDTTEVT